MAHFEKINQLMGELVGQLITLKTGLTPKIDGPGFQSLHNHTLNTLKSTRSVRTNQFEISERLEGLAEKFRILNNDELADALQARLRELETKAWKRTPEILSLFLQLSDNPAQKSGIEKLDQVERPSSPAPLTWADVFAEDQLDNREGIWDTVEYADEGSEDDAITPELDTRSEDRGSVSSQKEDEPLGLKDIDILPIDFASLDEIARAQFWSEDHTCKEAHGDNDTQTDDHPITTYITETQVIREVMFMLLGLPSILYSPDVDGYLVASARYGIRYASVDALQNTLNCFSSLGVHLKIIREYVKRGEKVALIQSFQAILAIRLREVENLIAKIQERIMKPRKGETVTLLNTLNDIQIAMLPLSKIAETVVLRCCKEQGNLHAPRFLHLAAKRILKTGKSVVFLERLGHALDYEQEAFVSETPLDYSTVCSPTTQRLCPFTDLFSMALNEWITRRHLSSSMRLREVLGGHCGLWSSLDALDSVYFSPDGAIRSQIASSIFRRIDQGRRTWNDRFILTGIFHERLAYVDCVDTRRLAIRSVSEKSSQRSIKALSSICISYTISWAVANIIKPESSATYQRVFILLLQVERAQQLLYRRQLIRKFTLSAKDDEAIHLLILSLHHRLLWFVNTLQTYLTTIVLPQSSAVMRQKMQKAEDLDEMINVHQSYILHLQDRCLLSERLTSTYQAIISLLDLTVLFSDISASYAAKIAPDTQREIARRESSTRQVSRSQRRKPDAATSSEDTDAEEISGRPKEQHAQEAEASHLARLRKLSTTFTQLLAFVHAGLQEAIRTGKEACWEILADDLALGLGRGWG